MTDTKPQTIFRAAHGEENPYFMMLRTTAQDSSLSFEARGLISYLLSKPNDWEISETDLRHAGKVGRDKMKKLIAELVGGGYMVKDQPHDDAPDTKGRFLQNVYILYETPKTTTQEPLTEKPLTALPLTAKPQEHNKDSLENTDQQKDQKIAPNGAVTEKPLTDHQAMFQAVCFALGLNPDFLTPDRQGTIGRTASAIRKAKGLPEHIPGFMQWLEQKAEQGEWSGGVTENAMRKYWADYASQVAFKPPPKVVVFPVPPWRIAAGLEPDYTPTEEEMIEVEAFKANQRARGIIS